VLPRHLSFNAALQLVRAFEENLRHAPHGQLATRRAHLLAGSPDSRLQFCQAENVTATIPAAVVFQSISGHGSISDGGGSGIHHLQ
jgi:hypothetical protein